MRAAVAAAAKAIFCLALFAFFILLFGVPALRKYQEGSVMPVESEVEHGNEFPTLTVCPSSGDAPGTQITKLSTLVNFLIYVGN